jgi:hypothetical protein
MKKSLLRTLMALSGILLAMGAFPQTQQADADPD